MRFILEFFKVSIFYFQVMSPKVTCGKKELDDFIDNYLIFIKLWKSNWNRKNKDLADLQV